MDKRHKWRARHQHEQAGCLLFFIIPISCCTTNSTPPAAFRFIPFSSSVINTNRCVCVHATNAAAATPFLQKKKT